MRYKIIEKIGETRTGILYVACDLTLNRVIILKIFKKIEKFIEESKILARLYHPNIIVMQDFVQEEGNSVMVMEFLEGGTLKSMMEKTCFPIQKILNLMIKLGAAVHYIHTMGIFHRDLNPDNIMFGKEEEPKLMNFELAKISRNIAFPNTNEILGRLEYMAPEQAEGKVEEIDARSDVYSLGVIFYEMLTRKLPFSADTAPALLHQILNINPQPPHKVDPKISKKLSKICMKALSKQKADRYSTALAFIEDLKALPEDACDTSSSSGWNLFRFFSKKLFQVFL